MTYELAVALAVAVVAFILGRTTAKDEIEALRARIAFEDRVRRGLERMQRDDFLERQQLQVELMEYKNGRRIPSAEGSKHHRVRRT